MYRSQRTISALVASAALVLASCGGSDTAEPTGSEPTSSEAAPDTADGPVETDGEDPGPTEPDEGEPTEPTEPTEELEASDIGVTEDRVRIGVAVADLEAVRAAGISIPDTLTTEHLYNRWDVFAQRWNANGGINRRQVEMVQFVWDPLDPSSFDSLCAEATIDEEVFMVLNGTGLSGIARECIMDSGFPVIYGDVVAQNELDTGLMVSLAPPTEVVARAGVEAWVDGGDLAPGAKVGVLASNSPAIEAAGAAAEEALTEAGYEVQVIAINSVGGDNAATNEEGAAAVGVFQAEGAEHVFVATPFTENTGFWTSAASASLPFTLLDTSSSGCSTFGLSRAPAAAVGSSCVTAYDHPTSEGAGIREDTEFEAECRAFFDESFSEYYGGPSNPGVPAGQVITDSAGTVLNSDYTPQECTIANVVEKGLTAAGANPTRESFMEAVLSLGDVPIALAAGGEGTLAPDKPYMANQVHTVLVTGADPTVAPSEDGLYNGCAAPVNCGVVIGDWSPIT